MAGRRRSPSLERRLPLLMSGVLAAILLTALAVTYATLARSAMASSEDRLHRAARQLASLSAQSVRQEAPDYLAVARDSTIRRALRAADSAAGSDAPRRRDVEATLSRLVEPSDSGTALELWSASGRRVAHVGPDVRPTAADDDARPLDLRQLSVPSSGLAATAGADSMIVGPLYAEDGRVHLWFVVPVREDGRTLGHIAHQQRIGASGQIERTIRELTGDSVTAYYRNADGGFWTTLSGRPAAAPLRDSTWRGVKLTRPAVGEIVSAEEPVAGTPLVIVMELGRRRVLAEPQARLLSLTGIGVVLLVVGAGVSWLISRRITRPIASLTAAVEAIAQGNYDVRAEAVGRDEVARLATSFNRMAREISVARGALERQSAAARATAEQLAQSNSQLVAARETAEAASRAKTDFLAIMSHELRTPLNAIGGYTELMEMELRGPITDAQRRDLERIRLSQQHLLGLISAVLDMNRIERGHVSYHSVPVPLDPFLAGLDALVGPQAAAKSLALEYVPCAPELTAIADREKLRQVLLNLLSNAIRCTPAGGVVTLAARERDAQTVEITVSDTGIGIPDDKQAEIFEPFVQLDRSLTRVRDGVGLGLAISRELARGMGGELTVESQLGEGSRFTLVLPRGEPDGADPIAATGELIATPR